jgi:signal transduction histidine kinase
VGLAVGWHRRSVHLLVVEQRRRDGFARQLIDTQERERKRIAGELHDSLTQSLIVIRNLALLAMSPAAGEAARGALLTEISATAGQALDEVREIAHNLGPYQLDRVGLTRSILDMTHRVSSASAIRIDADVPDIDRLLAREDEISCYRIIQESVNNIVKHAEATEATLTIAQTPAALSIVIEDNGKGFEPHMEQPASLPKGFGLAGVAERVRMLDGEWAIRAAPGHGTRITLTIPLTRTDDGHTRAYLDRR